MRKLFLFLIIVLGLLQFRLWFGDSNILELKKLKQQVEELKQLARERKERNAALEAEVMDLKQGTDAIEERARYDLGMVREGEHFIQVLENPQQEEAALENKKASRPAPPKKPKRIRKPVQPVVEEETPAAAATTDSPNVPDNPKPGDE